MINEFVRLLNLRQRRLEDEGFSAPDVLYMGCFFNTKLTTDTRAGSLDRLRQVAGCDRCFLQQDLVVLAIHVGNCHWICVELDFRHNEAICFDSLGVSFIHIVCFQSSLAMQQEILHTLMSLLPNWHVMLCVGAQ